MIKRQLSKARRLIYEQFQKAIGNDLQKQREANQVLADHFFDEDKGSYQACEYIDVAKNPYRFIQNPKHRIIYFCMKYKICSANELINELSTSRYSIDKVMGKYKSVD